MHPSIETVTPSSSAYTPPHIKAFRRAALLTTLATYFLIFLGGLVRVSGAGLGCPDWPRCFDRWIPPTDASQLPATVDISAFNFTLAWIEYINRLVGVVIGFLILATAFLAVRRFSSNKKILLPSIASLLLVIFQGWYGSKVVESELNPNTVTIHLVVALVIISLLVYVTQQAYFLESPVEEARATYPEKSLWVAALWALTIFQVILGTQVRGALQLLRETMPLSTDLEWMENVGALGHIHGVFGMLVAGATWFVGYTLLTQSKSPSPLVSRSLQAMMGLMLAQVMLGGAMVSIGMPGLIQIFHQWIASVQIGLMLIVYVALREKRVAMKTPVYAV